MSDIESTGTKNLEYSLVSTEWRIYTIDGNGRINSNATMLLNPRDWDLSLKNNMEKFTRDVNIKLAEGWRPLGAPILTGNWLSHSGGGGGANAVQALIREKLPSR